MYVQIFFSPVECLSSGCEILSTCKIKEGTRTVLPAHPALIAMMTYYLIRGIVFGVAKMAGVKPLVARSRFLNIVTRNTNKPLFCRQILPRALCLSSENS